MGVLWSGRFDPPPEATPDTTRFWRDLRTFIAHIQNYVMRMYVHDLNTGFDTHARQQFARGGGSLFKYIARGDAPPPGLVRWL